MAVGSRVVVAGEALVDLVPDQRGSLTPLLGGGPFNTARTLGRLGQAAAFVGAVSRDRFGVQLAEALARDGVDLSPNLRTDRPTSLAMAEIDARGAASYRFYFAGTSAEGLTPDTALAALPEAPAALHVGGLGLVLEPMAQAVEALVARLAGQALVMVDPNVRSGLIANPVDYAARLARVIAKADVVKASDEDLDALYPERSVEASAKALLTEGPRLVLLTRGDQGVTVFAESGAFAVAAPKVAVVDTIGAGDTFSGAWLTCWLALGAALDDPDALREATHFACAAAALSCTKPGAVPPTTGQLKTFLRRLAA
jgi:fructokinase